MYNSQQVRSSIRNILKIQRLFSAILRAAKRKIAKIIVITVIVLLSKIESINNRTIGINFELK